MKNTVNDLEEKLELTRQVDFFFCLPSNTLERFILR